MGGWEGFGVGRDCEWTRLGKKGFGGGRDGGWGVVVSGEW